MNALEVFTGFYENATYCPWPMPPDRSFDVTGTKSTLHYNDGGPIAHLQRVRVGWNTASHSCRLSGMCWGPNANGIPITKASEYGTVPGGGTLTKVGPNYQWTIHNDTPGKLALTNIEFDIFTKDDGLTADDLVDIATNGILGTRLALAGWKARHARRHYVRACAAFVDGDVGAADDAWKLAKAEANKLSDRHPAGDGQTMRRIKDRMRVKRPKKSPKEERPTKPPPASLPPGGEYSFLIPQKDVGSRGSLVIHGQTLSEKPAPGGGPIVLVDWVDRVLLDRKAVPTEKQSKS